MDATRLYPTHSGPALFEVLLDGSKRVPSCFREVYGYEGADHGMFKLSKEIVKRWSGQVFCFPEITDLDLESNMNWPCFFPYFCLKPESHAINFQHHTLTGS
jgi:hypothetical protein